MVESSLIESSLIELSPVEVLAKTGISPTAETTSLLSAVSDPVRWAVLRRLSDHGTTCVCDLQARVPVAANLLSYHLKVLRDAQLVTTSRRGRWVDYTLADDAHDRLRGALPLDI
jgi:ArsR family transcriptional regulator